jgi:hypothetical protein
MVLRLDDSKAKFYLKLIKNSIQEFNNQKIDLSKLVGDLATTIESLHDGSYKDAAVLWDSWKIMQEGLRHIQTENLEKKSISMLDRSIICP